MSKPSKPYTGGCLCGAVRYSATGEPTLMGHCYCADCRKASGSGFIPFMGFPADQVSITGRTLEFSSPAARGGEAVRNSCPVCGGLVFGGRVGRDDSHTIYAGSLDEPDRFKPTVAIFTRGRPAWAVLPPKLKAYEALPE
jgi:hypothetical protein